MFNVPLAFHCLHRRNTESENGNGENWKEALGEEEEADYLVCCMKIWYLVVNLEKIGEKTGSFVEVYKRSKKITPNRVKLWYWE